LTVTDRDLLAAALVLSLVIFSFEIVATRLGFAGFDKVREVI
jgi:hypothetical protein